MKSEKEIAGKLRQIKTTLKEARRNFEKYDNYDDMHAIEILGGQVGLLDWVLEDRA